MPNWNRLVVTVSTHLIISPCGISKKSVLQELAKAQGGEFLWDARPTDGANVETNS
jgi:hypothetical protein